jgi:imidazolonepropionase-like amidohydrolase
MNMGIGKLLAAIALISIWLVPAVPFGFAAIADDAKASATLYTGVSLFAGGPKDKMVPDQAVLVEDGRIMAIGGTRELVTAYGDAKIVDTSGLYAVPGLIDTHVHFATQPNRMQAHALLRRFIFSGVTSVRDMAGDVRALADLARESRLQKIPAPDLYYSALMAGSSFFDDPRPGASAQGEIPGQVPWMQAITSETDIREAVTLARGTWATGIKIYANLDAPEVSKIAAEGQRQGIKVWAHSMVFPATPGEVVDAGVDVVSHVCRLAWEIAPEKPVEYHHKIELPYADLDADDPRLAALFARMKTEGTVLDATLWLYQYLEDRYKDRPRAKKGPAQCPVDFAAQLTAAAKKAGVEISVGTDVMLPAEATHPALFNEIEALVDKAGFTPAEALSAASLSGARVLGLEAATGSLAVGKRADIVFVEKNPLDDVRNLRTVSLTLKGGTAYMRSDYMLARQRNE